MNIEFLEDGSDDCPLVRIYGTDPTEFSSFHSLAQQLAHIQGSSFMLHALPGFRGMSGCTIKLLSGRDDIGANRQDDSPNFEWVLTPKKWSLVAGLIEPFAVVQRQGSHQWLSGKEARHGLDVGTIAVLLSSSPTGAW